MDFTTITIDALKTLSHVFGGYGMAIIMLTILIRLAMWPFGVSQQRSMKQMQRLQPKLKEIQNRYKSNPQMMQQKMMEFYKEHKFNPAGGCLPILLQMPVFIILYTALISPQFSQIAGDSSFLFINRLDSTIRSHSGIAGDGIFGVGERDFFSSDKNAIVYYVNGQTETVKVMNPRKALTVQGNIVPGQNMDLKISLDSINLPFSKLDKVNKAVFTVTDMATRESEKITFNRRDSLLTANVPTQKSSTKFHFDVLTLVILFGVSMFLSQKVLTATNSSANVDPSQKAMQESMTNMMPIMIMGIFLFAPIPAGVLLYMVVSNVFQLFQSLVINKQIDTEEARKSPKNKVIDAEVIDKKN